MVLGGGGLITGFSPTPAPPATTVPTRSHYFYRSNVDPRCLDHSLHCSLVVWSSACCPSKVAVPRRPRGSLVSEGDLFRSTLVVFTHGFRLPLARRVRAARHAVATSCTRCSSVATFNVSIPYYTITIYNGILGGCYALDMI